MKKSTVISEDVNFKAMDIGSFNRLSGHEFIHPKFKTADRGRIFIGELLGTTGAEVSFRMLPPGTIIPFLHRHHTHEEIYIFLKGSGQFQVDETVFPVKEGSLVRVSLEGTRTLGSDDHEPMIYMVVQARADSLSGYNVSDGYRVDGEIKIT